MHSFFQIPSPHAHCEICILLDNTAKIFAQNRFSVTSYVSLDLYSRSFAEGSLKSSQKWCLLFQFILENFFFWKIPGINCYDWVIKSPHKLQLKFSYIIKCLTPPYKDCKISLTQTARVNVTSIYLHSAAQTTVGQIDPWLCSLSFHSKTFCKKTRLLGIN